MTAVQLGDLLFAILIFCTGMLAGIGLEIKRERRRQADIEPFVKPGVISIRQRSGQWLVCDGCLGLFLGDKAGALRKASELLDVVDNGVEK